MDPQMQVHETGLGQAMEQEHQIDLADETRKIAETSLWREFQR
jgi:hypothetical protein